MILDRLIRTGGEKPTYLYSQWLFLRVLALTYLMAFGSLWPQLDGLIGEKGILPARLFLSAVRNQEGPACYWYVPTLCWLDPGNGFPHLICGGGVILSLILFAGLAPVACLALLWVFYLSLVSVGGDFLSFQWDYLLLEAGFLGIFLAPLRWRNTRQDDFPPSRIILFLFQWLLFRLMFCSGAVKLSSGDPAWRSLTALDYHYETQPLPALTSWFMNQLPHGLQKFSCAYMFGVELVVPFFIFGPWKLRPAAFLFLASLQTLILLTGNYGFFNWLALGLCLFALEDRAWPGWFKAWWASGASSSGPSKPKAFQWPAAVTGLVAGLVLLQSVTRVPYSLGLNFPWASPLAEACQILEPLHTSSPYGLFAVMTTQRPEIIVQGSDNGTDWKTYEFKWKAGDLNRAPAFVAPYQPRLDWQMWFAALGRYQQNPWFVWFLIRLLQGSPDVLGLLRENPFPQGPPKLIRAELWQYHFTDFKERAQTGNWWKAKYEGPYMPPFSLDQVRASGWIQ